MTVIKKPSFKRYTFTLREIEKEIKQIEENYRYFYPGSNINMNINPCPRKVKYDGTEKEFEFNVTITY